MEHQPLTTRFRRRLRRDWRDLRERLGGDSDRRGMVLIMTMTMITILAGLGSAAVVNTASDIRESGAYRIERATYRLAEAGTMAAVALAGEMQANLEAYALARSNKLTINDTGKDLLDLSNKGSYGRELRHLGVANYITEVAPPDLSTAVPGYDAAKFCFRTFKLTTRAQFGDPKSTEVREQALAGASGLQAFIVVGPQRCGG